MRWSRLGAAALVASLFALYIFSSVAGIFPTRSAFAEGGVDAAGTTQEQPLLTDEPVETTPLPTLDGADRRAVDDSDAIEGGEVAAKLSIAPPMKPNMKPNRGDINGVRAALQAYRQKRIQDAIIGFERAAQNNSFIARFLLAHIYRTGKGGVVNHRRAYDYYRMIADDFVDADIQYMRHAPYVAQAFVQLARYIEAGVEELDIKADPLHARILFEKAAHFGDVEGQYQLGRFLIESGQGRNVKLGQRWLTRAAIKNNAKAQAYLGALYWQGDLVSRKQALALAWIEFARRNAVGSVKNQVERLYQAVQFDMSETDRAKAQYYISRLREKYHVLWREEPKRPEEEESEFLGGIILAEPPQGLDQDQLEAKGPRNQYPVADDDGEVMDRGDGPDQFGFGLFNYGGFIGQ